MKFHTEKTFLNLVKLKLGWNYTSKLNQIKFNSNPNLV